MKLEKEDIVDAAFVLLDDMGIEQFKMRELAARLSVSATALYWHFRNKDELLMAMTGRIYASAYAALSEKMTWRDSLRAFGLALKAALRAHRDAARLCVLAKPANPDPADSANTITLPLVNAGLSREQALNFEAVITSYVLGWSIYDQNPAMRAYLSEMFDFEQSFRVGLEALLRGFMVEPQDEWAGTK